MRTFTLKKQQSLLPAPTHGSVLNRLAGLLITYPSEATVMVEEGSNLSRVKFVYDACGNAIVEKLVYFARSLDREQPLDGRSWYLMMDMYKIAAYLYERENCNIITDFSFDRLGRFLEEHIDELEKREIVPRLISKEAVRGDTGCHAAYALTPKDIELARQVAARMGVLNKDAQTDTQTKAKNSPIRRVQPAATLSAGQANKGIPQTKPPRTFILPKKTVKI